jgi:hypothetical protein
LVRSAKLRAARELPFIGAMRIAAWTIVPLWMASCALDAGDDIGLGSTDDAVTSVQRGTDRASAFSVAEAMTLKNNYGVQWTGVYIGGPCSAGSGWNQAGVTAIANATNWTFMPTYVGQQSSAICGAHHTLTTAQGTADGQAAANLMSTFGWEAHKNIPVALDLEAGAYESDNNGATAYTKGWVDAVHSAGYLAYVYSSYFAINHFGGGMGIDAVWIAAYPYTSFQNVSPYDFTQIGNLFSNHNRAWQYAGNVPTNGAGGVDCNTSDLLLAPAPGGTNVETPCAQIPADGRIVDETETCFTPGGPSAYMRPVTTAGYNKTLYWTHTTDAATEANFGEWSLDFAQAGKYHLEVYTDAAFAQSKQAKYVVAPNGMKQDVMIDQTAVDGWQSLGDFDFAAGPQTVHLSDNTGEPSSGNTQLVFDAVRVTPADGGGGSGSGSGSNDTSGNEAGGCSAGGGGAGLGTSLLTLAMVLGSMLGSRRRRR